MGYYVTVTDSKFKLLPGKDLEAYEILCELNSHDELKSGGSFGGSRPPVKWFSWMPEDYPSECPTWQSILKRLGFEFDEDAVDDEGFTMMFYDNKCGDEEHFFKALAPCIADGSYINWRGEDGDLWRWEFEGGTMRTRRGGVVWE